MCESQKNRLTTPSGELPVFSVPSFAAVPIKKRFSEIAQANQESVTESRPAGPEDIQVPVTDYQPANQIPNNLTENAIPNPGTPKRPAVPVSEPGSDNRPADPIPNPGTLKRPTVPVSEPGSDNGPSDLIPNPGALKRPTVPVSEPGSDNGPSDPIPNPGTPKRPAVPVFGTGSDNRPVDPIPDPGTDNSPALPPEQETNLKKDSMPPAISDVQSLLQTPQSMRVPKQKTPHQSKSTPTTPTAAVPHLTAQPKGNAAAMRSAEVDYGDDHDTWYLPVLRPQEESWGSESQKVPQQVAPSFQTLTSGASSPVIRRSRGISTALKLFSCLSTLILLLLCCLECYICINAADELLSSVSFGYTPRIFELIFGLLSCVLCLGMALTAFSLAFQREPWKASTLMMGEILFCGIITLCSLGIVMGWLQVYQDIYFTDMVPMIVTALICGGTAVFLRLLNLKPFSILKSRNPRFSLSALFAVVTETLKGLTVRRKPKNKR